FSTGDLLRMLAQVAELDADGRFRKSTNPRILLEALLLRFAHLPRTVELEALIRSAGGAPPEPQATPAPAPSGSDPAPAPEAAPSVPGAERSSSATALESTGSAPPRGSGTPAADPAAARGGAAPEASPTPASRAGASVEQALRQIVESGGQGLPPGLGLFLRAARVVEETQDRAVVEFPAGPALEMLDDAPARRALADAVAERVGRRLDLDVRAAGGEKAVRLTPERVKEEQVRKLSSQEPALDRAVKEWDLEMLD
ncbi:MAG TPA: hypothetical protein VK966_06155, partial [Longimicrobiales bacterium]|nr:hypothetical protein [Longimicrobiales bacterium]